MPRVSPGATSNDTSSTARTQARVRCSTPAAQGEVLAQAARLQQRPAHPRISMASRSPSDSRLNAIDVTKMATPGSAGTIALT